MTHSPKPGTTIIVEALSDLDAIIHRARESGNVQRFMADLDRWKHRVTDEIRVGISNWEADVFAQISIRPSWVNDEPIDGPLERHRAFLEALSEELDRRPSSRTVKTVAPSAPAVAPAREADGEGFYDLRTHEPERSPRHSFNNFLEREARVRGRLWAVMATIVALVLAALALY